MTFFFFFSNKDINSGSSKDWARGTANIPYSYVLELRPGDSTPDGVYGFTLPEDRMVNFVKYVFFLINLANYLLLK